MSNPEAPATPPSSFILHPSSFILSTYALRAAVLVALLAAGWYSGSMMRTRRQAAWPPRSSRVRVLTTIFPLYDFARQIGDSNVDVRNLLPPGVDPHEYALSPRDVETVANADLLIANGSGLDSFMTAALEHSGASRLRLVDCTTALVSNGDAGSPPDPHIWLD